MVCLKMYFKFEIFNLSTIVVLWLVDFTNCTQLSHFDYIIVGSGTAGSVLVNRLSKDPANKVLLLEAGERPPLLSEVPALPFNVLLTPANWTFRAVPNKRYGFGLKDQTVLLQTGKALGGTGQVNDNGYIRGNRRDYDEWAANGASGWDWENVFPYFLKTEDNKNLKIVANGYHGVGGDLVVQFSSFHSPITSAYTQAANSLGYPTGDFNGPRQTVFMPLQGTVKDGRRWNSLQAFIDPIIGRRNLKIMTSAFVTKILIDEHKRAYGVVFDHNGEKKEAFAKREVVVSAGTYNTPKLLMLSGIGTEDELERIQIPIISDVPVGRNLHNHISTFLHAFLVDTFTYGVDRITKEAFVEFLTSGTGILSTFGGVEAIGFINSKYNRNPNRPDIEIMWLTWSIASDKGTTLRTVTNINDKVWKQFEPFKNKDTVTCVPIVCRPKSRGFLTLRSSNPYDDPVMELNLFSHPDDLKLLVEGMKFCLNMSMTEPMKQFNARPLPTTVPGCESYEKFSNEYFACMALVQPLSFFHAVGTCKMGDINDPSTVVDPTLKVKGVKGLRVVDASIIPSIPAGHPYAIVTMIADKAADMILHDTEHRKHAFYSD